MNKVLFVNSRLSNGGSERVMTLLANEFSRREYDITMVLVREDKNEIYPVGKKVKLVRLQYGTKNKVVIAIKRFFLLRRLIRNGRFNSIISFMYDINILTILSCIGLNKKIVVSERNDPSERLKNRIKKIIECSIYRMASSIVIQTEDVKEFYTDTIQQKCIVIPNPINPDLPKAYEDNRERFIIAAGRFKPQKNFNMLLDAFASFQKKHPNFRLVLCGAGILEYDLKQHAKLIGIKQYVDFTGYIQDLSDRMLRASAYISTSNYEGISNTMLEALAMGVPTICTDCPVGGARKMIQNGVNGILIPVGDTEALLKEMNKLVDDEDYARRIGKEATKIRQQYSIEIIAEKWMKLL